MAQRRRKSPEEKHKQDVDGRARGDRGEARMIAPLEGPGLLLWLNTAARIRDRMERGVGARAVSRLAGEEATVRPEDTLREAGISTKRQARYQRRMSSLLAGR
jgi:hypothetical protein